MEFYYQSANDRIEELGRYYKSSESEIIKMLIRDCIEKTVNSTTVYKNFTVVLNENFKNILTTEEKFLTQWLANLKSIEDINSDLSKSKELANHTDTLKTFIIENENDMKLLSYHYVTFMKQLTLDLLQERGKILFDEILKVDLSEFKSLAYGKFRDMIFEKAATSFPVLGELYDKILFTYDSLKTLDIDNSIKEMFSNGEPILLYLENYNKTITNYINEVSAICISFEEFDFERLRNFNFNNG